MTKVKICATRSVEAATVAAAAGADFIGLVFVPSAKAHRVDRTLAKEICTQVKGKVQVVGVFQDMPLREVQDIIADCALDIAQFHGKESPEYLEQIGIKKIKAFRFPGNIDMQTARKQMQTFRVDYYLVDRMKQGEGLLFDLEQAAQLAREFPLLFAGGLTSENVAGVVQTVRPFGVDVASGVETDGKQDLEKIKTFIKQAKGADK